jgi:hypothetical protein
MSEFNKSGISDSRNSELDQSLAPSNNPSEKDRSGGFVSAKIMPHQLKDIGEPETTDVLNNKEIKEQFNTLSKIKLALNCCIKKES